MNIAKGEDGVMELPRTTASRLTRMIGHRAAVLLIAGALFAAIFLVRELVSGTGDALSLLYVVPLALVALEVGLFAGLLFAAAALALIVVWDVTVHPGVSTIGFVVRGVIFVSVAVLAGRFGDRMRATQLSEEDLRELTREERALRAELERLRVRLIEQAQNVGQVLDSNERERREIADQLHEDAAQTMAAALLTVGLLERNADGGLTRAQLEDARARVRGSIVDLRDLAGRLRPPALEELGLRVALERMALAESERSSRRVTFSGANLSERLSSDLEGSAYRVADEMLQALPDEYAVSVTLELEPGVLVRVIMQSGAHEGSLDGLVVDGGRLAATRARLELVGGSLRIGSVAGRSDAVIAEIPIRAARSR